MPFKFTPGDCCNNNPCEKFIDDFNREGPVVGNGWVTQLGIFEIAYNKLQTESENAIIHNGPSANNLMADAFEVTINSDNEDVTVLLGRTGIYLKVNFGEEGCIRFINEMLTEEVYIKKVFSLPIGVPHKIGYVVCDRVFRRGYEGHYEYEHSPRFAITYNGQEIAARAGDWSKYIGTDPPSGSDINSAGLINGDPFLSVENNTGLITFEDCTLYLNTSNEKCGEYYCSYESCLYKMQNFYLEDTQFANGDGGGGTPPASDVWHVLNNITDHGLITYSSDNPGMWSMQNVGFGTVCEFYVSVNNYGTEFQIGNIGILFISPGSIKITSYSFYHRHLGVDQYQEKTISVISNISIKVSINQGLLLINDEFICSYGPMITSSTPNISQSFYSIRIKGNTTYVVINNLTSYNNYDFYNQNPCLESMEDSGIHYKNLEGNFILCDTTKTFFWINPIINPQTVTVVLATGDDTILDGTYVLEKGSYTGYFGQAMCCFFLKDLSIGSKFFDIVFIPGDDAYGFCTVRIIEVNTISPFPNYMNAVPYMATETAADPSNNNPINQTSNSFFNKKMWFTFFNRGVGNFYGAQNYAPPGTNYGYVEYS